MPTDPATLRLLLRRLTELDLDVAAAAETVLLHTPDAGLPGAKDAVTEVRAGVLDAVSVVDSSLELTRELLEQALDEADGQRAIIDLRVIQLFDEVRR